MLIVADGRALNFIDYEVGQQQRWPIGNSPLSVLLNPNRDLRRFARVVQRRSPASLLVAGARPAPARIRHDHARASPRWRARPAG